MVSQLLLKLGAGPVPTADATRESTPPIGGVRKELSRLQFERALFEQQLLAKDKALMAKDAELQKLASRLATFEEGHPPERRVD